jgi:hypothetical protein
LKKALLARLGNNPLARRIGLQPARSGRDEPAIHISHFSSDAFAENQSLALKNFIGETYENED